MEQKRKDTLLKVIGRAWGYITIAYIIVVLLFLLISNVMDKMVVQQMHNLTELYVEQINQEINSLNAELVHSLLQNDSVKALPERIGPEDAMWYPTIYDIVDINRNLRLRYGSKYLFYTYDMRSGLLIMDTSIIYKNSPSKSQLVEALIEKQKSTDKIEWDFLETKDSSFLFNSYENNGKMIGCIMNVQEFLQMFSLENAGYKIVPCILLNEQILTASGVTQEKAVSREFQIYEYDIAKFGKLQLTIHTDDSLITKLRRLQLFLLIGVCCILFLIIRCIRYSVKKLLLPVRELVSRITDPGNDLNKDSNLLELAAVGERFDDLFQELQNLKIALYEKELVKQQMEMEYLKEQLRPHFFLNCLNLIHSIAEQAKQYDIGDMVGTLSEYVRYVFMDSHSLKCIAEEINHIENYLEICHLRYGDMHEFQCIVEDGVEQCEIPTLLLQTFVENAVKHASRMDEKISISLYAAREHYEEGDRLYLSISDTGKGFPKDILEAIKRDEPIIYGGREHVGIKNAMRRLQVLYQEDAYIKISNMAEDYGTVVEIFLPIGGEADEPDDC